MKTKAEIVQNLLDAQQITAEHAVILLTPDAKEVQYIYIREQQPYNPYYPWRTDQPFWQIPGTYCDTNKIN